MTSVMVSHGARSNGRLGRTLMPIARPEVRVLHR